MPKSKNQITFYAARHKDAKKTFAGTHAILSKFTVQAAQGNAGENSSANNLGISQNADKIMQALFNLNTFFDEDIIKKIGNKAYEQFQEATFLFVTSGDEKKYNETVENIGITHTLDNPAKANHLQSLIMTLIGAVAGFFLGLCLGSMSGPGAALSALAAGAKGAEIGASIGTVGGGLLGYVLSRLSYFNPKDPQYLVSQDAAVFIRTFETLKDTTKTLYTHAEATVSYPDQADDEADDENLNRRHQLEV